MSYTIIELDTIPRVAAELNAILIDARKRQRKRNLSTFTTVNLVAWGFFILFVWPMMQAAPEATATATHMITVYLPFVQR